MPASGCPGRPAWQHAGMGTEIELKFRIPTHRLAAVRDADRIITVEKGRVTEDGTHDDLLRRGGRYAGLWRHQIGAIADPAE